MILVLFTLRLVDQSVNMIHIGVGLDATKIIFSMKSTNTRAFSVFRGSKET